MKLKLSLLFIVITHISFSQIRQPESNWWYPVDGQVNDVVKDNDNNIVFIGGDFDNVGMPISSGVVVDDVNGSPELNYPEPDNSVSGAVPDGNGGWFICGAFNNVGNSSRNNIAHIDNTGSVSSFDVDNIGGVSDIALSNGVLYFVGSFTTVNGVTRNRAAAVDAVTGVLTAWNPNLNGLFANTITAVGADIIIGGDFTTVGGQPQSYLAKVDAVTGALDPWSPTLDAQVTEVHENNGLIYVSGQFNTVNGQARDEIASIDLTTGAVSSLSISIDGFVSDFEFNGGDLFIAGSFTVVNGTTREYIAKMDKATGVLNSWNPIFDDRCSGLDVTNGSLYVGGAFTEVNGTTRYQGCNLNMTTGAPGAWSPMAGGNGSIGVLESQGNDIFIGGGFNSVQIQPVKNLAALDGTTGELLNWDVEIADSSVFCLEYENNTLYVGGNFTIAQAQSRKNALAVDVITQNLLPWNPEADGPVYELIKEGARIYTAGKFTQIGGEPIAYMAALNEFTGAAYSLNANINGPVYALYLLPGVVYVGGNFSSVDGSLRKNIASVGKVSGNATSFTPASNDDVLDIEVKGDTMYFAGSFTTLNTQPRTGLAAVEISTENLLSWAPNLTPSFGLSVFDIELYNDHVYLGGTFNNVNGDGQEGLGLVDRITGATIEWNSNLGFVNPDIGGSVYGLTIDESNNQLFFGGDFLGQDYLKRRLDFGVYSPMCNGPTLTSISASNTTVCPNSNVTLSVVDPVLNSASEWKWYSGSCNGTFLGTGTSIAVNIGTTTATYFVRGEGGCVGGESCESITITVEDNQDPTISTLGTVTVNNDNGLCSATNVAIGTPFTTDNCSVSSVTNDAPTTYPVGTTTVTWIVTDGSGNTASAQQDVVVNDTEIPSITAPTDITLTAPNGACGISGVTLGTPSSSDNCSILSETNDAPSTFPVGTTTVTWTATDVNGNTNTATQLVTILDEEDPVINSPLDVSGFADVGVCTSSNVSLGTATFSDNCSATLTNDAPSIFPVGATTVTWTVTDVGGNTATSTQTITIVDSETPSITAPSNLTVNVDAGTCEATSIALGTPNTNDNCGVDNVLNDAPTSYPVGTNTVTWTVTDIHGNTNTATQTITVVDDELPTITAPSDIATNVDGGSCDASSISLGSPVTSDNCGVASVVNDAPSVFSQGTTTVTWTVTDDAGNTATALQTVTVVDDIDPVITAPADLVVNTDLGTCEALNVTLGTPSTSDNCSVDLVDNDGLTTYPVGSTTVTWTVTDASGNTSTAVQVVEVVDNEAPVISNCPSDTMICEEVFTWSSLVATDNCTTSLTTSSSHNSGDSFPLGITTVTIEYTDDSGNSSTCEFDIERSAPLDVNDFDINSSPILMGNDGEIDVSVPNGNFSYDWTGPNGFNSSDQNLNGLNSAGTYEVTITNEFGCEIILTVFLDSEVGVNNNTIELKVNIYPNPTNNDLYIDVPENMIGQTVLLFDNGGRLVENYTLDNTQLVIEFDQLAKGIYTLEFKEEGLHRKVVKN